MKRSLLAAAAMLMAATTAQAGTTYLSRKGFWSTFVSTSIETGAPICGMQVLGNNSSLMVKYSGSDIFIQVFKIGWSIPDKTPIPLYLAFDNGPQFHAEGVSGKDARDGASYVEFWIKDGGEAKFLDQFSEADKMIVGFDTGTQPPFGVKMAGSRTAADVFRLCSARIDANAAAQPYARQEKREPQPFGKKDQPAVKPAAKKDDGSI
jgi:hypothetical protein